MQFVSLCLAFLDFQCWQQIQLILKPYSDLPQTILLELFRQLAITLQLLVYLLPL